MTVMMMKMVLNDFARPDKNGKLRHVGLVREALDDHVASGAITDRSYLTPSRTRRADDAWKNLFRFADDAHIDPGIKRWLAD